MRRVKIMKWTTPQPTETLDYKEIEKFREDNPSHWADTEVEGWFHCFVNGNDGEMPSPSALIEMDDGKIDEYDVSSIKFVTPFNDGEESLRSQLVQLQIRELEHKFS